MEIFMALEQWEISLRKQLEDILEVDTETKSYEEERNNSILDSNEDIAIESDTDYLFNFSMILFFIVSLMFFLDLKYDLISIPSANNKFIASPQTILKNNENKKDTKVEEKLETIKDVINSNFIKIMNGDNKDLLFIDEKWGVK